MPFGLPALMPPPGTAPDPLDRAGAPWQPRPAPGPALQAGGRMGLLNGDRLSDRLAARYIYEHWFVGHLHFDEPTRLPLRTGTQPQRQPAIDVIASRLRRPRRGRVYYRLRLTDETMVAKTHMPLALGDAARLARLRKVVLRCADPRGPPPGDQTASILSSPSAPCRWLALPPHAG